jgi:hypothetical protein
LSQDLAASRRDAQFKPYNAFPALKDWAKFKLSLRNNLMYSLRIPTDLNPFDDELPSA